MAELLARIRAEGEVAETDRRRRERDHKRRTRGEDSEEAEVE